jgi:hypothetical protein
MLCQPAPPALRDTAKQRRWIERSVANTTNRTIFTSLDAQRVAAGTAHETSQHYAQVPGAHCTLKDQRSSSHRHPEALIWSFMWGRCTEAGGSSDPVPSRGHDWKTKCKVNEKKAKPAVVAPLPGDLNGQIASWPLHTANPGA